MLSLFIGRPSSSGPNFNTLSTNTSSYSLGPFLHILGIFVKFDLATLFRISIFLIFLIFLQEASCAYVICLMAVFWIFEVVPLAVTSLLPLVLYPLLGVVPASKVRMCR